MIRLAALLHIAVTCTLAAQPLPQVKAEAIDRLIAGYMTKNSIPGLSLAIAVDGEIAFSKAWGLADVENSVPAKPETMYRTASIGKSITATAAIRLVEQGKLDLDAEVQTYCPAFPRKQWRLTPRNLLSHTGGIRHYGGPHDAEEQSSTIHYRDVVEALAPFRNDPLQFEPGTNYLYSSYGYDVLGCVIKGAAGAPFMEVIRKLVPLPADDPSAIIPNRAAGYVLADDKLRNAIHVDMSNRLAAGGYLATAPQLARFAVSFIDCKLVTCASRDMMLKEVALRNGDTLNYGMGWAIGEDPSGHLDGTASHGGSSPGASGMLYIVPAKRLAIAFLTNLENARERHETAAAIAAIVLTESH